MKKVLLGTSAIALASAFATTANAVEWDVQVGGFFTTYAAYSDASVSGLHKESWNGVDSKQDAEIHFRPSITLDNGIRIGAQVELEASSADGHIDEAYLFVDGSFGRVVLGSENSAGYLMHYGAPDVTIVGANSGSLTAFMPILGTAVGRDADGNIIGVNLGDDFTRGTLGSTFLENARNNDARRFTYFTPRFAGFQVGVSYAREDDPDTNEQYNHNVYGGVADLTEGTITGGTTRNIFDIGANYVASFGDFDIAASGRYGTAKARVYGIDTSGSDPVLVDVYNKTPKVWGAGLNVGYAGFTLGGSFAEQNDAGWMDGQSWDAGISYETGPWGFSFTYMRGRSVDHENYDIGTDSGSHEKLHQYLAGVSYTLAKGVALNAFGAYVDFKEDYGDFSAPQFTGEAGTGTSGDKMDGWVVGTAMKISF